MSKTDLTQKVNELRGLRRMADELNAEIESLQDAIKAEMTAQEVDELSGSDWQPAASVSHEQGRLPDHHHSKQISSPQPAGAGQIKYSMARPDYQPKKRR